MPWHIYRALPVIDRAEVIAHFQECNLRDTYRAQRKKEAEEPGNHGSQRDQYLG